MVRRPSLKTVRERASKTYSLHDYPRCIKEDVMEFYPAIFCDDEVHKGAKCINCGLSVTHIFDWQNTEIQEEEN
mgnify:CR=1 FL=1